MAALDKGVARIRRKHKNLKVDESMKAVFGSDKASLIRFVNSAFGKSHDPERAAFRTHPTEYVFGDLRKVYSDLVFSIGDERYHIEFQTQFDSSMVIRIFEYSLTDALRAYRDMPCGDLHFEISRPLVIQVEEHPDSKDTLSISVGVSGLPERFAFEVPVVQVWRFSVEDLVTRDWYLLLPFCLLRYRAAAASGHAGEYAAFVEMYHAVVKALDALVDGGTFGRDVRDALQQALDYCWTTASRIRGIPREG